MFYYYSGVYYCDVCVYVLFCKFCNGVCICADVFVYLVVLNMVCFLSL